MRLAARAAAERHVTAAMLAAMEDEPRILPIGRTGRLEAHGLSGPDGNHALLVRHEARPRALLTGEVDGTAGERLIVTPIDDEDVEVRVDGDALAVWLGSAPVTAAAARERVPGWASLVGLVLLLAIAGFAILGSAVFFGWLFGALGLT